MDCMVFSMKVIERSASSKIYKGIDTVQRDRKKGCGSYIIYPYNWREFIYVNKSIYNHGVEIGGPCMHASA